MVEDVTLFSGVFGITVVRRRLISIFIGVTRYLGLWEFFDDSLYSGSLHVFRHA